MNPQADHSHVVQRVHCFALLARLPACLLACFLLTCSAYGVPNLTLLFLVALKARPPVRASLQTARREIRILAQPNHPSPKTPQPCPARSGTTFNPLLGPS
ncbi:hypothetical protein CGRA01v4_02710 [Colletotrichum graminicola]|nr:hypothetical protein CGRA01v4_02710 [Colletotrichum graminicola]